MYKCPCFSSTNCLSPLPLLRVCFFLSPFCVNSSLCVLVHLFTSHLICLGVFNLTRVMRVAQCFVLAHALRITQCLLCQEQVSREEVNFIYPNVYKLLLVITQCPFCLSLSLSRAIACCVIHVAVLYEREYIRRYSSYLHLHTLCPMYFTSPLFLSLSHPYSMSTLSPK